MTEYSWRCQACEQVNAGGATRCGRCECPSSANASTIEAYAAKFRASGGRRYECVKCGSADYKVGEIRASGGLLSSLLEVESEKFTWVSCNRCGYTEFYRGNRSVLRNLFDFGV